MGRYFAYRMHPFSVAEVATQALPPERVLRDPTPLADEDFEALWRFGGFPEPYLRRDVRFERRWRSLRLRQLVREDVRDLTQIQHLDQLDAMVRLLVERSGTQLVLKNVANHARVTVDTVRRWVATLSDLHLTAATTAIAASKPIRRVGGRRTPPTEPCEVGERGTCEALLDRGGCSRPRWFGGSRDRMTGPRTRSGTYLRKRAPTGLSREDRSLPPWMRPGTPYCPHRAKRPPSSYRRDRRRASITRRSTGKWHGSECSTHPRTSRQGIPATLRSKVPRPSSAKPSMPVATGPSAGCASIRRSGMIGWHRRWRTSGPRSSVALASWSAPGYPATPPCSRRSWICPGLRISAPRRAMPSSPPSSGMRLSRRTASTRVRRVHHAHGRRP